MTSLPKVLLATELPEVPEPVDADTGFVHEFVEETNQHDSIRFVVGDKVSLPISCDGFQIDPTVIQAEKGEEKYAPIFECTVTLRPISDDLDPLPETIHVKGLASLSQLRSYDHTPLPISLRSDGPYAQYVSVNKTTNEISLRISVLSESSDDDSPDCIYLFDEAWMMIGLESPLFQGVWNKHQNSEVQEGVLYHDDAVPSNLAETLNAQIDQLAEQEAVDWHPGSNDCVRDLVHPSLYPYVRGESKLGDISPELKSKLPSPNSEQDEFEPDFDRFGRPFEISTYQWLPSVFQIADDGRTTIRSYINNLDEGKYAQLYQNLCRLFEIFLPRFERVYAYLKELKFVEGGEDMVLCDVETSFQPDISSSLLRGRELNVITKIVDYELQTSTDKVDGVFHVEGMSSDHIIMTGLYIAHRDSTFHGGEILFQRAFLDYEGSYIFEEVVQSRHWKSEKIVEDGLRPLGKLETPQGRIVVFPNSHVHKLTEMTRDELKMQGCSKRRIVVFWVVDPDRTVLTTREVPKQQGVSMSHERALHHRILLMEERKKHKGKFNADRKISLCEH